LWYKRRRLAGIRGSVRFRFGSAETSSVQKKLSAKKGENKSFVKGKIREEEEAHEV
jgi:hypothetical protein